MQTCKNVGQAAAVLRLSLAALMLGFLCLGPVRSVSSPAGIVRLLFKSGFEQDTVLEPVSGAAHNQWPKFHGIDKVTGFSWDAPPFDNGGDLTLMLQVLTSGSVAAPGLATDYIRDTVETVVGHDGGLTKALKMHIIKPSPATRVTQNSFQIAQIRDHIPAFYLRYRMKLNPEILDQLRTAGREYWRELTAFKTASDYRLVTYISNPNGAGVPNWHAHGDNGGLSHSGPVTWYWQTNNLSVPLPVDEWFLMEFYMYRAADETGRFFWAVNGQVLGDYHGPTMGANREEISMFAVSALYGPNPTNWYQWLDDIEIWNSAPCGALPCGAAVSRPLESVRPPSHPPSGRTRK